MSDVVYVKTLPNSRPFFECLYCKEKVLYSHRFADRKGNTYDVCESCYKLVTGEAIVREIFLAQPNVMAALSANR